MTTFTPSAGSTPFSEETQQRSLVIAHRGGAGLWPENTLYGFERAVDLGVDVLETEIQSTADNILVLMHDSTVDRTTNGSGPVSAFTLDNSRISSSVIPELRYSSSGSSDRFSKGRTATDLVTSLSNSKVLTNQIKAMIMISKAATAV